MVTKLPARGLEQRHVLLCVWNQSRKTFVYCPKCGNKKISNHDKDTPKVLKIYEKFKKELSSKRMAGTKDTKQQCKKTKKNDVGEVMINVSLMKLSKGVLKSVKWKSRTLRVATDSRKSQLLTKAIDKHSAHDRTFNRYAGYTLAYPDGSEILTLPDRPTEIFQLDKYKEDVGKTYNRITFFLVLRDDIANEGKDSDTEPELWMNGDVYEGSVKLM